MFDGWWSKREGAVPPPAWLLSYGTPQRKQSTETLNEHTLGPSPVIVRFTLPLTVVMLPAGPPPPPTPVWILGGDGCCAPACAGALFWLTLAVRFVPVWNGSLPLRTLAA